MKGAVDGAHAKTLRRKERKGRGGWMEWWRGASRWLAGVGLGRPRPFAPRWGEEDGGDDALLSTLEMGAMNSTASVELIELTAQ
jgi:hypothetical protein